MSDRDCRRTHLALTSSRPDGGVVSVTFTKSRSAPGASLMLALGSQSTGARRSSDTAASTQQDLQRFPSAGAGITTHALRVPLGYARIPPAFGKQAGVDPPHFVRGCKPRWR